MSEKDISLVEYKLLSGVNRLVDELETRNEIDKNRLENDSIREKNQFRIIMALISVVVVSLGVEITKIFPIGGG